MQFIFHEERDMESNKKEIKRFHFNEEGRIRLNLSNDAYIVIQDDIRNFGENGNYSGFLNRIFENYHDKADASIFERVGEKRDYYNRMFNEENSLVFKKIDENVTKKFVDALVYVYQKELEKKATSYEKGDYKDTDKKPIFSINKGNIEILKSDENIRKNAKYYAGSPHEYLKAIFEEYAKKPVCERERIYFAQTVDEIEAAIEAERKLKITMTESRGADGKLHKNQFYFIPYKIMQDKSETYNYLVGFSQKNGDDNPIRIGEEGKEDNLYPIRLSRIEKAKYEKSMRAVIPKDVKKKIDKKIAARGVQNLFSENMEFVVKFTESGEDQLSRQLFMRPRNFEKKSNGLYVFKCTEFQLIAYLFKFGKDAQVISPLETREKMKEKYKQAYDEYINE